MKVSRKFLDLVEERLEEMADQSMSDPTRVRADYSGKGMYGKSCVGWTSDSTNPIDIVFAMLAVAEQHDREFFPEEDELVTSIKEESLEDLYHEVFAGFEMDSMGRGYIHYLTFVQMIEDDFDITESDSMQESNA